MRGRKKKTHDEFIKEVQFAFGDEYTVQSHYAGANVKIEFKHNVCGNEFSQRPSQFMRGHQCGKCAYDGTINFKKRDKNKNEAMKLFEVKGLILADEYKNRHTPLKSYCKLHKNETVEISYRDLKKRKEHPCGMCCAKRSNNRNRYNYEKAKQIFTKNNFVLLEKEYIGYKKKMRCYCINHPNEVQKKTLHSLIIGFGCIKCNKSKGEREIETVLLKNNIAYESEYKFEDCLNNRVLPFDFFISNDILLEFDGEQHFKENHRFNKKRGFQYRKLNDEIKNSFCRDSDLKLIRIPHWESNNIEYILENILTYCGLIRDGDANIEIVQKFLVNHPNWSHEKYLETGSSK